jgi:peptidoglycan hydrolase-like protein with peptidoglycan-binding domain
MRKYVMIILAMVLSIYMFGCAKKQGAVEEAQEPMSMESLTSINATTQTISETKATELKNQEVQSTPLTQAKLEPLPPAGPYKPKVSEIQAALKNAGYYTAAIDGKIGPQTRKATEEFQKANGLQVDGKVGPKTWAVLSKYLNPAPAPVKSSKKGSRS